MLIVALFAAPVAAQTWPPRVQEIVNALAAGVPHTAPDEERRAVTQKIAEQVRFELGPNWGWKRADPGRPLSTDVFAMQSPFIGWDWSVPGGVAQFPQAIDLEGQVFVAVAPVNHLGLPDPGTNEPDLGTPVDLAPVLDRLDRIEAKLDAHEHEEQVFRDAVRSKWARFWKGFGKVAWKLTPAIAGALAGVIGS